MIRLKIDHIEIQAEEGISILEAAGRAGIHIPSMCYLKGYGNHPSCMVCVVKDNKTKSIVPSCAVTVADGMDISAGDEDVKTTRRQALELLLSDHSGDCEAPCSLGCPAGMNIPLMNRLIAEGRFTEALTVVKEDIALPYVLGYICPAPCEKACRRKQADEAVSVCTLKRFTAATGKDLVAESISNKRNEKEFNSGKKVAVIGSGPAGLSTAYYLLRLGHSCDIFEKSALTGGTLRYVISEEILPKEIIDHEVTILMSMGATLYCNTLITPEYFDTRIRGTYDAIVLATGDIKTETILRDVVTTNNTGFEVNEKNMSASVPGIFVCGSAVRPHKMAVRSGAQGKTAAMAVHQYLQGESYDKPGKMFNSRFDRLLPEEIEEYLKEASRISRLETNADLKTGFTASNATREALRCMHCDCRKQDSCLLRMHADAYQVDRKKFMAGDRKIMTKQVQHDLLVYEPEKCIKCGLCVDISVHEGEKFGLAFEGRGFDVVITPSLGKSFNESLSHAAAKCAVSCPTGALSMKE
ncbi:MAG TPA: 2Fe-2S iron-sulfur cluster-binding protein [Bacteroidales bacterium]|nr:2Fe-2S iron-sulfur cluster-binding protein [Bacteroidales bacterium]